MTMQVYPSEAGHVMFDPQQLAGLYNAIAFKVDRDGNVLAFTNDIEEGWGWYDIADLEPVSAGKKIRTQ